MPFSALGLSDPLIKALTARGYQAPTPIQVEAIPAILLGRDIMAAAQTGTGKTAGFTLPILERLSNAKPVKANQVRALILVPTRELAAQVEQSVIQYARYLPLRTTVVFGGVKINPQMMRLRRGVDILVATPGRLLDLYNQNAVKFDQLEILVLDEADRMLDMGFITDIQKILKYLPVRRQNLMFSATFSDDIRKLARGFVRDPVEVSITPEKTTAEAVEQWVYSVDKNQKPALLTHLIKQNQWRQILVFVKTKQGANKLTRYLEGHQIIATAIHGNKSQGARTRALTEFKNNNVRVLVATDLAARGLDIDLLPHVINFDLPHVAEDYVHRIGRTGRAKAVGEAISFVSGNEAKELFAIERIIGQLIPRKIIAGYEPVNELPESRLDTRPLRPKKLKKPKKKKQHDSEKNQTVNNTQDKG